MKIKTIRIGVLLSVLAIVFVQSITLVAYEVNKQNKSKKVYEIIECKNDDLSTEERDTLDLINQYRNENGLQSLKPVVELQRVAKLKAEDIVNNDYFAHDSDTLGTPFEMLEANNVEYGVAGENLAGNTTPKNAVQEWINSQDHRDNILDERFGYTGICVIDSEEYGKVFVQLFIGLE